jgi:hypothetical protein
MTPVPPNSSAGVFGCGKMCDGHIWSSSGSGAIVTFYCRIDGTNSEPWYPCYQIINPGNPGNYVTLANSRQYKGAVESYSAGTLYMKYFSSSQ